MITVAIWKVAEARNSLGSRQKCLTVGCPTLDLKWLFCRGCCCLVTKSASPRPQRDVNIQKLICSCCSWGDHTHKTDQAIYAFSLLACLNLISKRELWFWARYQPGKGKPQWYLMSYCPQNMKVDQASATVRVQDTPASIKSVLYI